MCRGSGTWRERRGENCFLLHRAISLQDLRVPPGNRLEELKGRRKGQHSIRINDQWRLCFVWRDGDAFEVEITDYH
jgi:toxin HigB-1